MFQDNGNNPLSYSEICQNLGVTKKEKSLVSIALDNLENSNTIIKNRKRYKLSETDLRQKSVRERSPNLIEGILDATPLSRNYSFAFVRTEEGDYFVSSEDILNAYHGDTVLIDGSMRRGKRLYGVITKIVKRANESLAGDIKRSNSNYYFICSNPKIHNWFNVMTPKAEYDGKKVVLKVINWGNKATGKPPLGIVTEVLGDSGNPEVEVLGVIRQYNLPLEFPEEVMLEATAIDEVISDKEILNRRDMRDMYTFTIDPASAKDFDDAISVKKTATGYDLYVHIADVAHYVPIDSHTFSEALNRGNSYYFPKKVIPMLPEKLSNKVCSLRPDEEKLTMTVFTQFDKQGNTIRQELFESVIRSNHRLSYEEVDELFEGRRTDLPKELINTLYVSKELSRLLSQIRNKAGYLFFDLPDIEYIYDQEGFIKTFTTAEETESHKLIENFMLIANEYVATKLTQVSPISLYRIHENPDYSKIERLANTLACYGIKFQIMENLNKSYQAILESMPTPEYHIVFDRMVLRSMKKAKYSIELQRHFGLSIEAYTHFTSPIRRLCDLVVHHLCKSYALETSTIRLNKDKVKHIATVASEKEIVADESEREIERVYNRAYMTKKIGFEYSGIVIGVNASGLIVRLNELPITGVLKIESNRQSRWDFRDVEMKLVNKNNGYYYQLLDKVKVSVLDVSDDVYFELCQKTDSHIHTILQPIDPNNRFQQKKKKSMEFITKHKRRKRER